MTSRRPIALVLAVVAALSMSARTAHAATVLDQSFEAGTTWFAIPSAGFAQVVTPGITGSLTSVEVALAKSGSPSEGVSVRITGVSGGVPTGPDLASTSIPDADIPFTTTWIPVTFTTPASITAGVQFAIIVSTLNTNNDYKWEYNPTTPYAGGQAFWDPGSGWSARPNEGFDFRTYVTTQDYGPPPPPVMQQFGKPASGTCDAAAPTTLNWSGVASGGWGESWGRWEGYEGPVCTRTLVYSTAQSKWVVN